MALMVRADEIRWSLADPEQPAACHIAEDVGPPSGLTASRQDLVIWWRWRYAALKAENARVIDLLAQALGRVARIPCGGAGRPRRPARAGVPTRSPPRAAPQAPR